MHATLFAGQKHESEPSRFGNPPSIQSDRKMLLGVKESVSLIGRHLCANDFEGEVIC